MARTDTRFKNAYNQMLVDIEHLQVGAELASEASIATSLGVSRTIVRAVLRELSDRRVIHWNGRTKTLRRTPLPQDRFSKTELTTARENLDRRFLEWVLRCDVAPDTRLNIRELASRFSVSPSSLNEFLTSFSRFGLIERHDAGGWVLRGFTLEYAKELIDYRFLIELDAAKRIADLPRDDPFWVELDRLKRSHLELLPRIDVAYHDFSELDDQFHSTIIGVRGNRFIRDMQQLISLIFHYHYQWNKQSELQRNKTAIREHINYIEALRTQQPARIEAAVRAHLSTARQTLLDSVVLATTPAARPNMDEPLLSAPV